MDNAKSPVKNNVLRLYYYFYLKEFSSWVADFTIYNFEETKGAFSRFYDNITKSQSEISPYFAQFGRSQKLNIPDSQACGNTKELGDFKLVFYIIINFDYDGINLYRRKEKSIWDCLANIAALGSTIFNLLKLGFEFIYSNNFDNYKIIENIVNKKNENYEMNNIEIEINKGNNLDLEYNLINKKINDINESDNNNDKNININDADNNSDNENNCDDEEISNIKIPKLRFYDFIFNNIYIQKCCKSLKKQKLISSCNDILYKYYSIENILYNQIQFENLIKDYHWNNPKFKSIFNNDLIIKLNNSLNKG